MSADVHRDCAFSSNHCSDGTSVAEHPEALRLMSDATTITGSESGVSGDGHSTSFPAPLGKVVEMPYPLFFAQHSSTCSPVDAQLMKRYAS
jgi:hypothetical protein